MPYCVQCGNQVRAQDRFCARCGAPQPVGSSAGTTAGTGPGAGSQSGTSPGTGGATPFASGLHQGLQSGLHSGLQDGRNDMGGGISPRTAAILCYVPWFGWIPAIIVLASERMKRNLELRFHAFQGLYLFFAWLVVDWVISPMLNFGRWAAGGRFGMGHFGMGPFMGPGVGILTLLILAGWIVMMIKASRWEHYRLPIVGDLAERSVAEQRI